MCIHKTCPRFTTCKKVNYFELNNEPETTSPDLLFILDSIRISIRKRESVNYSLQKEVKTFINSLTKKLKLSYGIVPLIRDVTNDKKFIKEELDCCLDLLKRDLNFITPKLIIPTGIYSIRSIFNITGKLNMENIDQEFRKVFINNKIYDVYSMPLDYLADLGIKHFKYVRLKNYFTVVNNM